MAAFVKVLNYLIRLSDIKKISIAYFNGMNFGNKPMHSLFVYYKDGTSDHFRTAEFETAKADYEGLETALLNYGTDKDGGKENA